MMTKADYQLFCQEAPDLPIFLHDWYLDSICSAGTWDLVSVEKEGQTVGVFPYYLKQKGPFRYITMPVFAKFMGPYLLPEFRQSADSARWYQALYQALPKVSSFTQNFYYSVDAEAPFPIPQLSHQHFYGYRLESLADLPALRAQLARYYRNNILKKAPQTLTIRHDLGIEAYFEINVKTYRRQGVEVPFSLAGLRQNMEALTQHQASKTFFAVDTQGRVHAAALLIWDKETAYYHSAGGDPELRKSGAGIYIVWEMIRYAAEVLQLQRFDFVGSMIPAIEKLWKNFGAQPKQYFHAERHSKLFLLAQKVRKN